MNSKRSSIRHTDIRQLESALWQMLREESAAVLVVLDADDRILQANAAFEAIVGRRVQGVSMHEFVIDFHDALSFEKLCAPEAQGQLLHISTGRELPVSFRFYVRRVGEHTLLFGESPDADMRRLRAELLTMNNELHDLSRQLQKRNRELEELVALKNRFLGMAAHDLRNPLGVIISFSELLLTAEDTPLTDAQRESVEIMFSSGHFMVKLIDDLLDISAVEEGGLSLRREPVHIAPLIRSNLLRNRLLADRKKIIVEECITDNLPVLHLDRGKFEQILNNLLSNALKFSTSGSTITVTCAMGDGEVLLSVRDEGPGIPADEIDLLFRPFARTSVRSTGGERSTGLGLSIVKRIVEGHGGRIRADSVVGEGSTFTVHFPLPEKSQT
ncbi:MAG: PAS domain-containing sensor histidine kinase [Bacteroidota bacterium]|nr:PAS domain-containing sensor histidine kinase [Bacteroidota bacterium]